MNVISKKRLTDFWSKHPDSEQSLKAWYDEAKQADWITPHDIKKDYQTASFVGNNRTIFNIKGNTYRLVVSINYLKKTVYIRFIGSHAEYYKIDALTV